jgi:hypothetical protein
LIGKQSRGLAWATWPREDTHHWMTDNLTLMKTTDQKIVVENCGRKLWSELKAIDRKHHVHAHRRSKDQRSDGGRQSSAVKRPARTLRSAAKPARMEKSVRCGGRDGLCQQPNSSALDMPRPGGLGPVCSSASRQSRLLLVRKWAVDCRKRMLSSFLAGVVRRWSIVSCQESRRTPQQRVHCGAG